MLIKLAQLIRPARALMDPARYQLATMCWEAIFHHLSYDGLLSLHEGDEGLVVVKESGATVRVATLGQEVIFQSTSPALSCRLYVTARCYPGARSYSRNRCGIVPLGASVRRSQRAREGTTKSERYRAKGAATLLSTNVRFAPLGAHFIEP
ncbi:RNA editing complex protein MP46 [Anopheles sinensis]|uniref:RNA editing complex protein MP46 n=1 Tax=Anopheles sinensis TaxID=74873 RepID=A0A084VN76_ANOSI|nr:RNA editing complex protein MP46 [Anopheles sinensis]